MRRISVVLMAAMLGLFATSAQAQKPAYPAELPGARAEVYRSTEQIDLSAWIYVPGGHCADTGCPAIVFFFGGGWNGGSPGQFRSQAEHLAERGMVAIVVDYRVKSRQGTLANIAVSDAKAAIRWVRVNAGRLGIDPQRIAAGGGSAAAAASAQEV